MLPACRPVLLQIPDIGLDVLDPFGQQALDLD
jgi:hypothetical protein